MTDFTGKTALVVDDEPDAIDFMTEVLKDSGFETVSASNGREAMERVNERIPDVVFLDLMMPEQSGTAFFNDLKRKEGCQDIPVIIVSGASKVTGVDIKSFIYDETLAEKKKKLLGIDAKPNAYLEKPVDPERLIAVVKEVLS
jgi:CheY-like chemotaxis protein